MGRLCGWKFAMLMKQDDRPTKGYMRLGMTRWRWCMDRFGTWEKQYVKVEVQWRTVILRETYDVAR